MVNNGSIILKILNCTHILCVQIWMYIHTHLLKPFFNISKWKKMSYESITMSVLFHSGNRDWILIWRLLENVPSLWIIVIVIYVVVIKYYVR